MMHYLLTLLMVIHGLIHLLGFVKAFRLAKVEQLKIPISKPMGFLWLISSLGFIFSATAYVFNLNWWFFLAIPMVSISQFLIIRSWSDAKFGTIPNLIILILALFLR